MLWSARVPRLVGRDGTHPIPPDFCFPSPTGGRLYGGVVSCRAVAAGRTFPSWSCIRACDGIVPGIVVALEIFQCDANARVFSRLAERLYSTVQRVVQAAFVARIADQQAVEIVGIGVVLQVSQRVRYVVWERVWLFMRHCIDSMGAIVGVVVVVVVRFVAVTIVVVRA